MGKDGKLKTPPLVEALLEIKFDVNWEGYDYGLELTKLVSKLQTVLPNPSALGGVNLPLNFPEFVARHRLASKDGKKLVNVGENIICLLYTSPSPRD